MFLEAFGNYRKLKKSQWWETEKLLSLQWSRFKEILKFSYDNVPFYKEAFDDAGITPHDIKVYSDLVKLPTCDKNDLRAAFPDKWLAKTYSASDCSEAVTSGSTGDPLKFYIDKGSLAFRFAVNMRTLEISDYHLGHKLFQVSPPVSGKLNSGFKEKLINTVLRRTVVPPFETDIENKFHQLASFKPKAIVGYTSYIKSLADMSKQLDEKVRIPVIMTTSEMLLPETRKDIEETFGGKVFDQYGSVEMGRMSAQCNAGDGYHINAESVLVEVIGRDGKHAKPGEEGELICTNLMNYTTPFIRYKVGDFGTILEKQCSCGRGLPLMGEIGGRLNDIITTPSGKKIMPEYFYLTLREIKGLNQFQVVQTSASTLKILYTPEEGFDEARRIESETQYKEYLKDMTVSWEKVKEIKKISGKHKHIISL